MPMETNDDIVIVRTMSRDLTSEQNDKLEQYIEEVLGGRNQDQALVKCNSFIMNEANLSPEERARLAHWRQAHRQCGEGIIRENCPICEEGKRKTKGFKRNEEYRDMVTQSFPPYHRLYADGYGGTKESRRGELPGSQGRIRLRLPLHWHHQGEAVCYLRAISCDPLSSPARSGSRRVCV